MDISKTLYTLIPLLLFVSYSSSQEQRSLSIHVLDTETGKNGPNMTCKLYQWRSNDGFVHLNTGVTDQDGRISNFIPLDEYVPGIYQVWFDTKSYYRNRGTQSWWPAIQVTWKTDDPHSDHHIPITVTPFGFGTYRGT